MNRLEQMAERITKRSVKNKATDTKLIHEQIKIYRQIAKQFYVCAKLSEMKVNDLKSKL